MRLNVILRIIMIVVAHFTLSSTGFASQVATVLFDELEKINSTNPEPEEIMNALNDSLKKIIPYFTVEKFDDFFINDYHKEKDGELPYKEALVEWTKITHDLIILLDEFSKLHGLVLPEDMQQNADELTAKLRVIILNYYDGYYYEITNRMLRYPDLKFHKLLSIFEKNIFDFIGITQTHKDLIYYKFIIDHYSTQLNPRMSTIEPVTKPKSVVAKIMAWFGKSCMSIFTASF
jgi:hypothetical protein